MPFDPRTSSWIAGSVDRCPQGRPEFFDTVLMTNIMDFIIERCWDLLGFEHIERACESATLSLVQQFLALYYEYLTDAESCTTCRTPFSESTFIKLVGIPSLQADKPYKVFLVHRYRIMDGDVKKEILCYPENEERCYFANLVVRNSANIFYGNPELHEGDRERTAYAPTTGIPVARILPMPRDRRSPGSPRTKLLKLYKRHREERTKRLNQFWMPKTIFEETETSHHETATCNTKIPVIKRTTSSPVCGEPPVPCALSRRSSPKYNTRTSQTTTNVIPGRYRGKPRRHRKGVGTRRTDDLNMSETSEEVQHILAQRLQQLQLDDESGTCLGSYGNRA
ncbi:hypothetical protein LSH36_17g00050 [Paralvinella palmiformis]|uniref:Uncharacterized protein n=1 Tax=Paralvinella palmiformis TaxID=53620 RepID=A0AAD9KD98_9ANNE|nr:hypothetical protein LSH36_17g00050 [Paralvinella palmiformis]